MVEARLEKKNKDKDKKKPFSLIWVLFRNLKLRIFHATRPREASSEADGSRMSSMQNNHVQLTFASLASRRDIESLFEGLMVFFIATRVFVLRMSCSLLTMFF